MYPDIDIYLSKVSVEDLFDVGSQLAKCEKVYEVVFAKSRTDLLPGGLYLKPRIEYGDWGRPWKIDIWSLDDELIDAKMAEMRRFARELTEEVRTQILRHKHSVLTKSHRTPMYSGYHIYRAFIEERLTDSREVTAYLVDHGIRLS